MPMHIKLAIEWHQPSVNGTVALSIHAINTDIIRRNAEEPGEPHLFEITFQCQFQMDLQPFAMNNRQQFMEMCYPYEDGKGRVGLSDVQLKMGGKIQFLLTSNFC